MCSTYKGLPESLGSDAQTFRVSHHAREDAAFGGSNNSAQCVRGHGASTVTGCVAVAF